MNHKAYLDLKGMIYLTYTCRLWYCYACASLNLLSLLLSYSINEFELFVTDQAIYNIVNRLEKRWFLPYAMDLPPVQAIYNISLLHYWIY